LAHRNQERHERGEQGSALPELYYLDESDPDILILRRKDDSFVAAFSAQGAIREAIVDAANEDYQALLARERTKGDRAGEEGKGSDSMGVRG
jgi:hypothetical protein